MPRQMGYLMVDHRASPGLPEDIARAVGYDPKFCGEGKVFEQDTMTCSHCKNVVVKNNARTRDRAKCFECDNREGHYICDGCDFLRKQPDYVHTPFTKFIDDHLRVAANPCCTGVLPEAPTAGLLRHLPVHIIKPMYMGSSTELPTPSEKASDDAK